MDPRFYAGRHALAGLTDSELRAHYGYVGRYEDRFPNDLTEWVANVPVHLWQMGKVGSLAIQDALLKQHGRHAIHLHYLDHWHREYPSVGVHYSRLLRHYGVTPKRVVCGVRDPIDRVISGYFQEAESLGIEDEAFGSTETAVARLAKRFIEDLWITCTWFAHGFFCSHDPFQSGMAQSEGSREFHAEGLSVFIYRLADLPRLGADIGRFLGEDGLRMQYKNVSSKKKYSPALAEVKKCVDIPDRVVTAIYASRYCRAFGFCPSGRSS